MAGSGPVSSPDPIAQLLVSFREESARGVSSRAEFEALKGRYLGRVCVLSFRTHQVDVDALVEDMAAAIDQILS